MRITALEVIDIRFPTSRTSAGTDAMHLDPDYSAAYVILRTGTALEGHGLAFTIGRGNDICASAIEAFTGHVVGRTLDEITADFAGFWRSLAGDSQLRWLGPEKGVIHMALAAVVNAVWDLYAKRENKPLWKLLADMTPRQIVSCIDFRYITDALTPDDALAILEPLEHSKATREAELRRTGYQAYNTSVGWFGYSDEQIRALCREGLAHGWRHFKVKVGGSMDDDRRRVGLVRREIGPDCRLMIDANQRWDVAEAIARVKSLEEFDLWWMEEPTSPDDVLGHAAIAKGIAPVRVATGEHCANRVIFKQLFQAGAIGVCQIDACRLGGVNENLAVLLMAAKFGVPVCPHAGGVGLCEMVQHLSMFDFIAVSGTRDNRVIEFVDHLHEHFLDPVVIKDGRYMPPSSPGYGTTILAPSREAYAFPHGAQWRA